MKFVRQSAYNNAIQRVRVEFGTLIGLEKDEDAYVVLKELPTLEMMQLNEAHEKGHVVLMKFFHEVIPHILVDHNLYETEEKKMTDKAVTDFIFEKLELTSKIVSEYAAASFFTRLNKAEEK